MTDFAGESFSPSPLFGEAPADSYPVEPYDDPLFLDLTFHEGFDPSPYLGEGLFIAITRPAVTAAVAVDNTSVDVTFSKQMLQDTALLSAASYSINNSLAVFSVRVQQDSPSGTVMRLTTSAQVEGRQYLLTVVGVQDTEGFPLDILADMASFVGLGLLGHLIFDALIKPVRDADRDLGVADPDEGARDMLDRYLIGPQTIHERTRATILSLKQQVDPIQTRADLLQYLKDIVGFTLELDHVTSRLSETQLRRLIRVAVALWKQRYTKRGLVNAIRILTGRTPYVTDWFGFRFLLGEAQIGEEQLVAGGDSWIIGGATTDYDEFWSNIRVMDDGSLDELLLIDICRLMRGGSERMEVFLSDFIERFDADKVRWNQIGVTVWNLDIVNQLAVFPAGAEAEAIVPIVPVASLSTYVAITKFTLGTGGQAILRWYVNVAADTYYYVHLQEAVPQLRFIQVIGGVPTTLVTINNLALTPLFEDVPYKLRVQTINESGQNLIRIYIDNELVVPTSGSDYTDAAGGRPSAGVIRLASDAGGGDVTFDNVEVFRLPGRYATIEIGSLDEPDGEVTFQTDNFVQ